MTYLSEYKDIFGRPNEGVHSHRVFDVAIVDVIATIIVSVIIAMMIGLNYFLTIVMGMFGFGVFFHWLFGVDTKINKMIFK